MHSIIHHISIHAPAASIYQALTTMAGIGNWWAGHGPRAKPANGGFSEKVVTTIRVDDLIPSLRVSWTILSSNAPGNWPGTTITFGLYPHGCDTELSFAHRGFRDGDACYNSIKRGWLHYMISLKQYVEHAGRLH